MVGQKCRAITGKKLTLGILLREDWPVTTGKRDMFKLDPEQSYMMPAHFGPRYTGEKSSGWYRDVTMMVVAYRTDREKLAAHLPAPFAVAEDAVVTVAYARNKQVDWLAGRGYNLLAVNASVVYQGEQDQLTGSYTLVMWENLTDPILRGRELHGIPKIYADISDHHIIGDDWHCSASHFGNAIVDMAIGNLTALSAEEIAAGREAQQGVDNPMGWRYLPAIGGFGAAGVNEATTFPSDTVYTEAMLGEGAVHWNQLSWEQNPTQFHIVNALADLPVLDYLPALVTRGSANLAVTDRWPRGLR